MNGKNIRQSLFKIMDDSVKILLFGRIDRNQRDVGIRERDRTTTQLVKRADRQNRGIPQRGEGAPRPMAQVRPSPRPACLAATRILSAEFAVSAEQLSKRVPVSSLIRRRLNGVMTGRGALICRTSFIVWGWLSPSKVSILDFSS